MSASRVKKVMNSNAAAVRVVVRVRPFLERENKERCVKADPSNNTLVLTEKLRNSFGKTTVNDFTYKFDGCYDENSTQKEIFKNEVKASVNHAFEGYNTTVLCYGVTSSGKTYTMQGTQKQKGIIPQTVKYVLSKKASIEKKFPDVNVKVSMQYCEIFKDKVWDLLVPKKSDLPVRETAERRILVANLAELPLTCEKDFHTLYDKGCENRRTGATNMNHQSSRSHAVVMIHITYRENQEPYRLVRSKLHLIDLAGSEDNRQTGNRGDRLVESSSINSSLFVLGNVINSLNAGHSRIPFRDSKITRLLQDSLGGKSYATMIINVSPSTQHFLMTYATLNFGSKARNVLNNVVQNTVIEREMDIPTSSKPDSEMTRRHSEGRDVENVENKESSKSSRPRSKSLELKKKRSRVSGESSKPLAKKQKPSENRVSSMKLKSTKDEQAVLESKADQIVCIGKQRLAKELIIEAKSLRSAGKLLDALVLYRASADLLPDNQKLASKIVQLQAEVDAASKQSPQNEKENLRREVNALLSPATKITRKTEATTKSISPTQISRIETVINDLNCSDEKTLVGYAKIGKATAKQIVVARELHHFESIACLSKIGKSTKWIETFRTANSLF